MRDPVLLPLGGDQGSHRYRPIASLTQRATERLRTSRSIASSAFSFRSRASSARSSSPSAPSPSGPGHPITGPSQERIKRRPVLGGLINEYGRAA